MKSKRLQVLIQMDKIAAYRVPLYNLLAEAVDLDVAYHSELGRVENTTFKLKKCRAIKFGPFTLSQLPEKMDKYDVVITIFDGRNLNALIYVFFRPGKTILYCLGFGRSLVSAMIRRLFHNRAAATLVYTQGTAQQLIKSGVKGEKVFYTGNTVEVGKVKNGLRRYFINMGTPKPRKRVEDVIEAFAMVKQELPEGIRLLLVGPGTEDAYAAKVSEYGLNDVTEFRGEVRDEVEISDLFSRSIAFVSGHVGLSAPQSLGHGVPVVARVDIEQGPEFECVVDGYTGRTYRSVSELSEILVELASCPEIAEDLGRAGFALYNSSLNIEKMRDRFLQSILYVMAKNGSTK